MVRHSPQDRFGTLLLADSHVDGPACGQEGVDVAANLLFAVLEVLGTLALLLAVDLLDGLCLGTIEAKERAPGWGFPRYMPLQARPLA